MKLSQIFKKRLHKKMLSGVEMVKIGVLDRLTERYQPVYGEETATPRAFLDMATEFYQRKP